MEIKIGASMRKQGEDEARKVLKSRYPGKDKEIEACLKKNFVEKKKSDGNTERSSPKPSNSK